MESLALLIGGALAVVMAAMSYLFGRRRAGQNKAPPANGSNLVPELAGEIARLQERERTLSAEVVRQAGEIQRFSEALFISQSELGANRERLTVADERTSALIKTLADERQSAEAARRALSAELNAAIEFAGCAAILIGQRLAKAFVGRRKGRGVSKERDGGKGGQ